MINNFYSKNKINISMNFLVKYELQKKYWTCTFQPQHMCGKGGPTTDVLHLPKFRFFLQLTNKDLVVWGLCRISIYSWCRFLLFSLLHSLLTDFPSLECSRYGRAVNKQKNLTPNLALGSVLSRDGHLAVVVVRCPVWWRERDFGKICIS